MRAGAFTPPEKNYSSMKQEFLGMKWAMTQKLREYLLGQKCVVWTDINPLSHLRTDKLGVTEQRWVAELAVFDYTVRYHPGRSNQNEDALSKEHLSLAEMLVGQARPRTPVPETVQKAVSQHTIFAALERSTDDLTALQGADTAISAIYL